MIAIFDLDGTLASCEHRVHFLEETPKNWDAFHKACVDDSLNIPIAQVYDNLSSAYRFILTGRSEEVQKETEEWLRDNGLEWHDGLYMRKKDDYRDDIIIKQEMFRQLQKDLRHKYKTALTNHTIVIFEDRQKVVDMWREMGLTCCQVAPGNF